MSKHTIIAFRIAGDAVRDCEVSYDGVPQKIFATTKKDFDKIKSALNRWCEFYEQLLWIEYYMSIAQNITDKQLKKFNLKSSCEILDEIFECDGMVWYYPQDAIVMGNNSLYGLRTIKYVKEWNSQGNKKWWNDFKEELEEAKYNPRNVLGKLEFDRRAEADGIIWKDEE